MGPRAGGMPPLVWGLLGCCSLCAWALGGPQPLRSLPPLSSQAQPESVPIWMSPEGTEAALAFLYSGDAQQLLGANCSKRYEARGSGANTALPPILHRAAGSLAQAANFLNMLLQANDIRESSVEEDVEWYQALVRSVAEGDPRIYRALLTFSPPPGASHLQLALQATRMHEETILQDLTGSKVQEESHAWDLDSLALQKRVLTNDLGTLGSPKWPRGDGYVGNMQHIRQSPPFLECQQGRLRPGWLITLSATFYGLKPDLSPEVRGQVRMDVDLQSVDINQCASGPGWYSNTHLCDLNSTQCVPLENQGFVLGRYLCRCRLGFYKANGSGGLEENTTQPTGQFGSLQGSSGRLIRCQPCPEGCTSCVDAKPCLVEEAPALRAAVLACQACCILAVFLSMLVSYRCRWNKRIRASGITLLETILFGSLLLYFPVFILYFKPSVFHCIALRWVRLLGFVIVYGTIILKLYRVLQLFLSPTAQHGPLLSSGQLLQRLGLLLLLVLGFLVAWTTGVLEPGIQHTLLVARGHTRTGHHFYLCHHHLWDYIMVVAEILLLCCGSFLCYTTRAVPSAFHEPRYMGIALHNELLLSAAFHTARFALVPSLHPDWTLLLFFFHTHSTVSTTLALIFIPKFRKLGGPPREEMVDEMYEDELDLRRSGSYFHSSIASAWSERSLDPSDIRDELKKLYAQLEIHKTKEMAVNNPHLPKKRGSLPQGLGRSFMRYLAEFPEALVRQHSSGRSSLPCFSHHQLLSSSLQEHKRPQGLRKSHSTYDHHREQDAPLPDSLLRRKVAKVASQAESRESVEGAPALGFRSASAHNLMVGERLPRVRPTSLHKSLSVVTGSREKALQVVSQAYLEESYQQAKEQECKKAEASPGRRPSVKRLERAWGAPLSAPPSPAKSSPHASRQPRQEVGRRLLYPPIRHQVSTPILTLSRACLGEPRMLSPSSTLAPALMPAPAWVPAPAVAPVPAPPQSPSLLTYICPWENVELPVRKENVTQEGHSGPERGSHSSASARTRVWRALSVAVEKRGAGENETDTEDRGLQGKAEVMNKDRPTVFSKSHSLKAPVQQGSMRSLGLAIRALTHSRSTYLEKDSREESPEREEKGRASGESVGSSLRSPRVGRPKGISQQAALASCDDEESLQNQQNAHTSRMLQVCQQEGSREQEDRGRRKSQGWGDGKAEKAGDTGHATLRKGRQGATVDKKAEQAKPDPRGWQEWPEAGLLPLGSAAHRVAEICPWEVTKSEMGLHDSQAEICPWEVSEGSPKKEALKQKKDRCQEKRGKVSKKLEPKEVVAIALKKPERLVRGQEAACVGEGTIPGGLSPQSAPQNTERTKGRSEAVGSGEAREVSMCQWEAAGPEVYQEDMAKAELSPWETRERGEEAAVKELAQEKQKILKKATFWKEHKLGGDWGSLCPWESTDFQGPTAVSTMTSGTPECSGNLGSGITEVCPWEAEDARATRKAEISSWELGAEMLGKETKSQGTGGESLQKKGKASREGSTGEMEEQALKSQQQESVCWRERTATGHSSPGVGNSPSKAGGSRLTQVCPWEDSKPEVKEGPPAKAGICPWKVNGRTGDWVSGQAPKGGKSQKGQEKLLGQPGIKEAWGEPERQIPKLEAVCPQERVDPGSLSQQPGSQDTVKPEASFQMSGRVGSKAAETCPWDVEENLPAEKANICPWEASGGAEQERALGEEDSKEFPSDTEKTSGHSGPRQRAVTAPKKPERPAWEQEVAHPWEGLGPGGSSHHSQALNTSELDRSELELQDLDSVGCRPVEVCPWEVSEGMTEKGLGQETGCESAGQKKKTLEKRRLTSLGEDVSKWEVKLSQKQESVCPWETTDLREPPAQVPRVSDFSSSMSIKVAEGQSLEMSDETAEEGALRQDLRRGSLPENILTREKAACPKAEFTIKHGVNTCRELRSVHPWDTQCIDQSKTDSQGWVSVEVPCPWDVPNPDTYKPDSSSKVKVCPWEASEKISENGVSGQDGKGKLQEKGNVPEKSEPKDLAVQKKPETVNRKEAVCVWESQDCGGPSPQPAPQPSDRSKDSSEAAGGVGARVADTCLWEAEETPSAKRAEICPQGMSKGAAKEGRQEQDTDRNSQGQGETKASSGMAEEHFSKAAAAKPSREQETVCPWKGTDSREPFLQPDALDIDQPKVSPHEASSRSSRSAELCQWEVTGPDGNNIKGTMAEICPWGGTGAPSEESGLLALTATQTEMFVTTAYEKLPHLSMQRPLGSFLPESKSPHPEVSRPASTFTPEGVRELQGPSGLRPGTSLTPELSLQEAETQNSSSLTEDQKTISVT